MPDLNQDVKAGDRVYWIGPAPDRRIMSGQVVYVEEAPKGSDNSLNPRVVVTGPEGRYTVLGPRQQSLFWVDKKQCCAEAMKLLMDDRRVSDFAMLNVTDVLCGNHEAADG